MMGGLRLHEFTLLCAPTGAGKTQLLANLSAQLLIQEVTHFVAPVETGDVDFLTRVMSTLCEKDLNTGDPWGDKFLTGLTNDFRGYLGSDRLLISTHDNRVQVEEMINTLKYMSQEYGAKVAILDNLNFFLKVVSSQMEKAEMDNAIHEFVILAKKIPMHIILVVHPKKTDNGRVLSEFDIKGSSTAVQEASNVILFNRPCPKEHTNRPFTDRELVFRKLRKRGMNVGKPLWFQFENGQYREESTQT